MPTIVGATRRHSIAGMSPKDWTPHKESDETKDGWIQQFSQPSGGCEVVSPAIHVNILACCVYFYHR